MRPNDFKWSFFPKDAQVGHGIDMADKQPASESSAFVCLVWKLMKGHRELNITERCKGDGTGWGEPHIFSLDVMENKWTK